MKKITSFLILILVAFSITACGGMSAKKYDEISNYVLENSNTIFSEKETEFFEYETTGLSIGGVYFGYYYTANNEVAVPGLNVVKIIYIKPKITLHIATTILK